MLTRRDTLILAAASAAALTINPAFAQETIDTAKLANVVVPDVALGPDDAKVTVIEYASPTCPHCASFHNDVYPEFKAQYVDTGKVRFIVRPFTRNVLDAVVFMLANKAGSDNYYNIVDTYFRTQAEWATSQSPKEAMLDIAVQLGFTAESFEEALLDQELFQRLEAMNNQAIDEFGLEGTPTFYVNGKRLGGGQSFDSLAAEIDPLL